MKIPRKKEKPEQLVIIPRITRLSSWFEPVITEFVLAQIPRQVREIGVTYRISYHCHLNRKSPLFRDRPGLPQGRSPG
jgi:hypothetical protein